MKNIFALVICSLMAFCCVASPPGMLKSGETEVKFELPACNLNVEVQDMTVINCVNAFEAAYQFLEFAQFPLICELNSLKHATDAGTLFNAEISPSPAELGVDTWRLALKKFHFAYINLGYRGRSNSPPPNLS